jgi:hypothetical protein
MQHRLLAASGIAVVIALSSVVAGQQPANGRGRAACRSQQRPFNARELGGIWSRNGNGFGGGGTCRGAGIAATASSSRCSPRRAGAFDKNIPSYGR